MTQAILRASEQLKGKRPVMELHLLGWKCDLPPVISKLPAYLADAPAALFGKAWAGPRHGSSPAAQASCSAAVPLVHKVICGEPWIRPNVALKSEFAGPNSTRRVRDCAVLKGTAHGCLAEQVHRKTTVRFAVNDWRFRWLELFNPRIWQTSFTNHPKIRNRMRFDAQQDESRAV